ncbi:MAG: zinc ABC transporter substrate-binding protein [Pirellulaceae bacterium]
MSRRIYAAVGVCLVIGSLFGCRNSDSDVESGNDGKGGKLDIVCTTGMVADLVRQVVGERAEVRAIMKINIDPHLFTATTSDVRALGKADIVFYSGLFLEGRMVDAFEKIKESGKPIFAVADGVDKQSLRSPSEFEGHPDPHIWMDVQLWSCCLDEVVARMAEVDPDHADEFAKNGEAYAKELDSLHEYAKTTIASIPKDRRVMVTAHDAFGYYSLAYGIAVRSAQGITTESEPGVNDINKLVDFLVAEKIPAIFVESSVSADNIKALIEGAGSKGHNVNVGGELFSDAMGAAGTYRGTYLGMIDHNTTVIALALDGTDVSAGGKDGKLADAEATVKK